MLKLHARNNIFKKKKIYGFLNILYFAPKFDFLGTALGPFSLCVCVFF